MPLPRIAIVGRPNVGKSSLLNLLAKKRVSIVDPTPGVTRDRVSVITQLEAPMGHGEPIDVEVTDTGGFGVYVAEGGRYNEIGEDLSTLTGDIEHQIDHAVKSADLVLFVLDSQAGVTALDDKIAKMLRERVLGDKTRSVPIMVVANKTDSEKLEADAYELAGLGFGEPLLVSAQTKYMRRELIDRLYEAIDAMGIEKDPEVDADLKLAIVGKRNAGKSTLVNTLAGEPRVIVSEIAGTTRDAVDVKFEMDGKSVLAIDTAGLRKKKSFTDQIEWYAYDRAQLAIKRADVALLMVDATVPTSQVDEQMAMLVQKSFKPVVIVVNKWDMVEGRPNKHGKPVTTADYEKYLRKELGGLTFAPIAFMSAKEGRNVREVIELAFELQEQSRARITTGVLNRIARDVFDHHLPASKVGKRAKLFFASQVAVNPPTVLLVVNDPKLISQGYERYLINRLREELDFAEVPVKLLLRKRKRADLQDLLTGEHARMKAGDEGEAIDLSEQLAAFDDDPDAYFDED